MQALMIPETLINMLFNMMQIHYWLAMVQYRGSEHSFKHIVTVLNEQNITNTH